MPADESGGGSFGVVVAVGLEQVETVLVSPRAESELHDSGDPASRFAGSRDIPHVLEHGAAVENIPCRISKFSRLFVQPIGIHPGIGEFLTDEVPDFRYKPIIAHRFVLRLIRCKVNQIFTLKSNFFLHR